MLQLVKGNEGFYRRKFVDILQKRLGYNRLQAKNFVRDMARALETPGAVHVDPTADGKIHIWFEQVNPEPGQGKIIGVAIPAVYVAELYLQVV